MAAVNQTGKRQGGVFRADLTIRRADPHDWQAILDIDASGGAYDEGDYLHGKLAAYLTDKNRFCYVGEIAGKVVSFFLGRAVDGGGNIIGRLARVDKKFRGSGVWDTTRYLTMVDYISRNSKTKRYFGCISNLKQMATSMPNTVAFDVLLKRSMFSVSAPRATNLTQYDTRSHLETLTFDLCDELLSDRLRSWRLFPHGMVVVGREPFNINKQNMTMIFEECKLILASKETTGETTILSFGTAFDSPQGHVWEVDIYTSSRDKPIELAAHVMTHFKSARTCFPDENIKLIVFVWPACSTDDIVKGLKPLTDHGHVALGPAHDHYTSFIDCDLYIQYLASKM